MHLLFDRHEVVLANGAPAESLLAAPGALALMPTTLRDSMPPAPLARVPARALPENGRAIRAFRARLQETGAPPLAVAPAGAAEPRRA